MRSIVAKRLRRLAYGKGHHPGPVIYKWGIPHSARKSTKDWVKKAVAGAKGICLLSDAMRLRYKHMKREYKRHATTSS